MATGFEVKMYHDIARVADALEALVRELRDLREAAERVDPRGEEESGLMRPSDVERLAEARELDAAIERLRGSGRGPAD